MMMNKNIILFSTFLIGQIPSLFFGSKLRYNLSLFIERSTRIDFIALYYANAINFLILAYCVHFNKNIDQRISKFILIVTIVDFFHLFLFASMGFGMAKIGICIIIYYIKNIKWQK